MGLSFRRRKKRNALRHSTAAAAEGAAAAEKPSARPKKGDILTAEGSVITPDADERSITPPRNESGSRSESPSASPRRTGSVKGLLKSLTPSPSRRHSKQSPDVSLKENKVQLPTVTITPTDVVDENPAAANDESMEIFIGSGNGSRSIDGAENGVGRSGDSGESQFLVDHTINTINEDEPFEQSPEGAAEGQLNLPPRVKRTAGVESSVDTLTASSATETTGPTSRSISMDGRGVESTSDGTDSALPKKQFNAMDEWKKLIGVLTTPQSFKEMLGVVKEEDKAAGTPGTAPVTPFDEEAETDPTILEQDRAHTRAILEDLSQPAPSPQEKDSGTAARKLLGAFNCNTDTTFDTLMGESMCGPILNSLAKRRHQVYDERFTLNFLAEATNEGIQLAYHEPPVDTDGDEADWSQSDVRLFIKPGNCHGSHLLQPKLNWSKLGKDKALNRVPSRRRRQQQFSMFDDTSTSIDLLDIHSILSAVGDGRENPDAETGFFSITTRSGDIYVLEAMTLEDRDRVVNGLRNIIARLSYHLIAGNIAVSSELYSEDYGQMSGELPSLRTPTQAMNTISHAFLD